MAVSDRVMRHLHNAQGGTHHAEATFLPEPEPRPRPYTIISVDDHLIEPAHLFAGRVPESLAERAPRVRMPPAQNEHRGCTKTASTRRSGSTR